LLTYNLLTNEFDIDEVKYQKRIDNSQYRHLNKLDIKHPLIEKIIELNISNNYQEYIMAKLKMFYWQQCENIYDFEDKINQRLKMGIFNIDEIIK